MSGQFKIGDYVEHCSLMPGVLMALDGDNVETRILGDIEYTGNGFANCSIKHCGVRKLTFDQVKMAMFLGREKLGEIYRITCSIDHQTKEEHYIDYDNRVREAYLEMIK